jgi:hypothetical protein
LKPQNREFTDNSRCAWPIGPENHGPITEQSLGEPRIDINERRRMGRQTKPRSQNMSTFNISDINFVGAYMTAVSVAKHSDHRNAGRHFETGEGLNVLKTLKSQVRRFAAITEERPAADQLSARPV